CILSYDRQTIVEMRPPRVSGETYILEFSCCSLHQIVAVAGNQLSQRCLRLARESENVERAIDARYRRRNWRRFLDNQVRIRSTETERANARNTTSRDGLPRRQLSWNPDGEAAPIDVGIGCSKMQMRRDLPMLQ